MELGDGHVERSAVGIGEVQEVALLAADGKLLQPAIPGDAVVHVHHVVAGLEVGEGGEGQRLLGPDAPPRQGVRPEDLLLGDQAEAKRLDSKAGAELPDCQADAARLGQLASQPGPQIVIPQDLLESPTLRLAARHQGDPLPLTPPAVQILQEGRDPSAVRLDAGTLDVPAGRGGGTRLAGRGREGGEGDSGPCLRLPAEGVPAHPALLRGREEGCQVGLPVRFGRGVGQDGGRPFGQSRRLVPDDHRVRGEIGQDRGGFLHEVGDEGVPLRDRPPLVQGVQQSWRDRDPPPMRPALQTPREARRRRLGQEELLEGQERRLGGGT